MSEIVQSERHGAVALLRLNRPEALNALSDELLGALCAALDAAEESAGVRCVVLCARRACRSSLPCTAGASAAAASSR
jgi:enoyl-CoA hydratase/carnithine racemase